MNKTLTLIADFARPNRGSIVALLALTALIALASAAPAYLMRWIVDGAMARHDESVLVIAVGAMLANAVTFAFLGYVQGTLNVRVSQTISRSLRLRIADSIYRVPIAAVAGQTFGSLMTRLSNDVDGLEGLFSGTLVQALSNAMQLAIGLGLVFQFSWQLGLAALVTIPAFTLPLTRMGKAIYAARTLSRSVKDRFNTVIGETLSLSGLSFIKSHVVYASELARLATLNAELQTVELRAAKIGLRYSLFNSMATMATPALMWFVGFRLVESHTMTLGALLASLTLFLRLFNPASSLAGMQLQLTAACALVDRLRDLLDMPRETDGDPPIADASNGRAGAVVEFDNVELRYDERIPVLAGASFTVMPGETVALCGASGSGKTSVAKSLIRFLDIREGSIKIDGTDIRDVDIHDLRRRVAVVSQEPFLLNDSIAANVAAGCPSATPVEIAEACRLAGAADFVASLPEGYATAIGDRGMRLSGGQRQRLALARLFLRRPSVIVLDEATSALDVKSEKELLATIEASFPACARLVITHRPSTLEIADRVINIRDGCIESLPLLDVA